MLYNILQRPEFLRSVFKPTIIYPPKDIEYLYEPETIQSTNFVDSHGVGIHTKSIWEISSDRNFNSIVNRIEGSTYLYSIPITILGMDMIENYFVRVQYISSTKTSRWSDPVGVTTELYTSKVNAWSDTILQAFNLTN